MYCRKHVKRCQPSATHYYYTHQGSNARIDDTMMTPYVAVKDTTMCAKMGSPILRTAVIVHTTAQASILGSAALDAHSLCRQNGIQPDRGPVFPRRALRSIPHPKDEACYSSAKVCVLK
jgi:hypothetical protein